MDKAARPTAYAPAGGDQAAIWTAHSKTLTPCLHMG